VGGVIGSEEGEREGRRWSSLGGKAYGGFGLVYGSIGLARTVFWHGI
jgi:hypothetical protein